MAQHPKLTIIGQSHARKGLVFTYAGETDEGCKACKLHKVCHDLEPHREYKIAGVRPVKHDVCHVFEGKVQVVEVEPLPMHMNVPVASLRGTAHSHNFEECGAGCLLKRFCNPPALSPGQKVAMQEILSDVECLVGRKLKLARVAPEK